MTDTWNDIAGHLHSTESGEGDEGYGLKVSCSCGWDTSYCTYGDAPARVRRSFNDHTADHLFPPRPAG